MSGVAAAEHPVLLLLELLDHVRAARQLVHHEGEGRGRGVVAGEHQGHQLVADLPVGEALARLVADAEQQAEHVEPAGVGLCAALGDLGEDDLVEHLPARRASCARASRGRAGSAARSRSRRTRARARSARRPRRLCPPRRDRGRAGPASRSASPGPASTRRRRRPRPARRRSIAGVASAIIASTEAATCSRWKAGIIVARAWSW